MNMGIYEELKINSKASMKKILRYIVSYTRYDDIYFITPHASNCKWNLIVQTRTTQKQNSIS